MTTEAERVENLRKKLEHFEDRKQITAQRTWLKLVKT